MKSKFFKQLMSLFWRGQTQPTVVPKQGENPTKKGYGVPRNSLKARRKALRLRQKTARRMQRR